jgi:hypothetical protein
MVAGDLLRLAWEAEHDGRSKLRDALMTLAVTESGPGDSWAERCRGRLLQDRPDHFLSHFPTVAQALDDPRVVIARDRLRAKYPPARVNWLLLKAGTRRGPYLGRAESLEAMIEDLVGFAPVEVENVRLDAPQPSRGPLIRQRSARPVAWSLAYPPLNRSTGSSSLGNEPESETPSDWDKNEGAGSTEFEGEFFVYYSTVLLAIAFLLATVQEGRERPI